MEYNTVPRFVDYKCEQLLNEKSLSSIYPDKKKSENPLPIYVISAHGICYHGVSVKDNLISYSLENSNSVFSNAGYSHNMFKPPEECYALHTSVLGSAAISSRNENGFLRQFLSGKKTRQNHMDEPNYVTFARQLFSEDSQNWIETIPVEILFQRTVTIYNETIEALIYDIYKNVKVYNLRRKNQKTRIDKKKILKYYKFPDLMPYDGIMDENDEIKMKNFVNRGKKLLKHAKSLMNIEEYCDYHRAFCELEIEVEDFNEKFKRVIKTRPVIGMPGIPTIEKYLDFTDKISTEKQNWHMGIIEISENTEEYLQKHTEIKFAERTEKIPNNTKYAQKQRIINNIHDKVLSGFCIHNNKTKTEWLRERINHTINNPETSNILSLSEIMYQFGRGIYICLNCSPLHIWNSNNISRFSKRQNPHYCLSASRQIKPENMVETEENYITPKTMYFAINDNKFEQIDIYTEIFNLLVEYNENLYNYWPQNIQVFPNSTRLASLRQSISPECYEIY